ncbi:hypothetical protein [Nonomuraea jabiensis]|uniref:Helix-turn-helix domain-containing protein n=1 Tax=Nonomuraea jabiensis TaxID=882448 RepID=A0A7W9G2W6_9ACTN|nr:hypothetical protein [Nonomuraea jabiensis]MBB5776225.1 hypothetical protein [Nonomuraea jabiensis]
MVANADRKPDQRLWPDQVYIDAVWESSLTSTQKIAALCYANHARTNRERDRAWVVYGRFMQQTGIRSRNTVAKVHQDLLGAGWLEDAGPRPGHKQIRVYWLALPAATGIEISTGTDFDTGTASDQTGTDFEPGPVRKSRATSTDFGTGPVPKSVRDPLSGDPLKDLPETSAPTGAATQSAAPSGETPAVAEEEGEPLPKDQAIARARASLGVVGKGKPASRWKPYRSSNEGPNPNYDPRIAAAAAGHLEAVEPGGDAA